VGVLTCVGWQVTLCDPIWQVTLRSCEMVYHEQLYQTFNSLAWLVHASVDTSSYPSVFISHYNGQELR